MLLRSYLMVAGDKEKHLDKFLKLKCDTAMINLEDGVYDKKRTRELLKNRFKNSGLKIENKKIVVRINSLHGEGIDDIKVINGLKPDAIRVPKIQTAEDVKKAVELIDDDIDVHLSIETKEAFQNLIDLKVDKRVTTVYLGILDMLESMSLPQSILKLDNPTIDYILSKFLVDSKMAGFYPVSFTYQEYKNIEEFRNWCKKVKEMGYTAKAVISPTQVEIVNEIFSSDEEIIKKAKYIKDVFEKSRSNGCTGFSDDKYGFIDEPIYKDALLVLKNI